MATRKAQHLSEISTSWTLFFQAFDGSSEQMKTARQQLLERYRTPVFRYLLAAVGQTDVADDLHQEFALRFIRGDFQRVNPDWGRFRYYLKTALRNLVTDYYRRQQRQPAPLPDDEIIAGDRRVDEIDEEYLACWKAELLTRTWRALQQYENETGKPFFTILRFRSDHPELTSEEMATHLTPQLKKEINAGWVRKRLHYAREMFADLLIQEVLSTLEDPGAEDLADELQDVGLLDYCRSALQRYSHSL